MRSAFKLIDKMKNLLSHAFHLFDEKKNNSEWNQMNKENDFTLPILIEYFSLDHWCLNG